MEINLVCVGAAVENDAICQAVKTTLLQTNPELGVHILQNTSELPDRNDVLALTLHIGIMSDYRIDGHFEWQGAGQTSLKSGPVVSFDVMDAKLNEKMYLDFATGLLTVSNLPLSQ